MHLRLTLMGLTAMGLSATTANAQGLFSFDPAEGGFIASGFVGQAFPVDADFSGTQNPEAGVPGAAGSPAEIEAAFKRATNYGGTIGYQLPFKYWKYFHPRLEFEISTYESDVIEGNFNGGGLNFGGEQQVTSYLINNYSDITWKEGQRWVPFIGGGLGVATVDTNIVYQGGAPGAPNPTFAVSGDDTVITSTFGGGLTLRATDKFEIYGEGRYSTLYNVSSERIFVPSGGLSATVQDSNIGFASYFGGIRVRF